MNFLHRTAEKLLQSALATNRIVSVVGCRQSGKTTLVRHLCPVQSEFKTLDSDATLRAARLDPTFFLRRRNEETLIIDEIQKVPSLIGELKIAVDDDTRKGQYVITGSADWRKLPHARESLAGRVGFVRVRAFSEAEFNQSSVDFLHNLFKREIPFSCSNEDCNKPLILALTEMGGLFEPRSLDADARTYWFKSYIEQQLVLDMRKQWGLRNRAGLMDLFRYVAAFSSKPLVIENIGRQMNMSSQTLSAYLSSIESMYLLDQVPAWTRKDYDRPGKKPKLFMTDTGLMCSILNISQAASRAHDQDFSENAGGKLVKTWAYNQMISEIECHPRWTLHHLRTKVHEIDFIVTDEENRMLAINIKSGESVSNEDFRHIRWFQQLEGSDRCTGVVLYCGCEVKSFGEHCYAIPIAYFWLNG